MCNVSSEQQTSDLPLGAGDIRALVRPDHVHRRAYADPQIFAMEQERIFGRLWIYVAHESQLKQPGDFIRTRLSKYEVLVTRHNDGEIYVLHNRCPHRGARLCMTEGGTSRTFSVRVRNVQETADCRRHPSLARSRSQTLRAHQERHQEIR